MRNQKGITLIELLAGIAILGIISSLVFGVLISTNKNYSKLSSKTDLSREANLIILQLKNYHLTNDKYKLDFKETVDSPTKKRALIGKTTPDIELAKKTTDIIFKAGYTKSYEQPFPYQIDTSKPVYIYIELKDKNVDKPYIVETVIKRY